MKFRIQRYDPDRDAKPYFQDYDVAMGPADRMLLDGTLNGLASMAQRAAGRLSRVQTGSLHKYAFLVLVGMVASLVWMWRNG